jgi:plasmid rolling circle replication initiator protein Rep
MYLADASPKDAKFDRLKGASRRTAAAYIAAEDLKPKGQRVHCCADWMQYVHRKRAHGEVVLKLKAARFCQDRFCELCQMLRTRMWTKQFRQAAPTLMKQHPGARWLMLTLTIRNPDVYQTRAALSEMNKAWKRLIRRKEFRDVLGWIRATEVTRGGSGTSKKDAQPSIVDNTSHPHFHILLMVSSQYFKTRYISQAKWLKAWQECMRDDQISQVNIKAIKRRPGYVEKEGGDGLGWLMSGALEVLKYTGKTADLLPAKEPKHKLGVGPVMDSVPWFQELARQVARLRFTMTGGALKDVFKDLEDATDEDLIHAIDEEINEAEEDEKPLIFGYSAKTGKYRMRRKGDVQ